MNLPTNSSKQHKYNKVTQQKKFHLLTLIYKDNIPVKEAAQIAGINYLTAKTIIFFHKNKCKSYQFDIGRPLYERQGQEIVASYTNLKKITEISQKLIKPKSRIEVICSIGNVLSPPKGQSQSSPTICSNCQDNLITKPSNISSECSHEPLISVPTKIMSQDFVLINLKQLLNNTSLAEKIKEIQMQSLNQQYGAQQQKRL